MNYNSQIPIAVFLGPTLELAKAREILNANYFPPVRMGDIYRLLGTGIHTIILIDGFFHGQAAVWQREILEALSNNIKIIGASSMGALRAAELYTFGMVGCGTIFEWYRDGLIDGDDEVALNHGDESNGYLPFSEPMVNIRYNLMQALEEKRISQVQFDDLIDDVKKTYYGDRSYEALFSSSTINKWSQKDRDKLIRYIREKNINLKERDAIYALGYCNIEKTIPNGSIISPLSPSKNINRSETSEPPFHPIGRVKRGFLHSNNYLIGVEELFAQTSSYLDLRDSLQPLLTKNFFLLMWAKSKNVNCSSSYVENFRKKWESKHVKPDLGLWMRNNGLTEKDFDEEIEKKALLDWVTDHSPDYFGIEFDPYVRFVDALLSLPISFLQLQDQENIDYDRRIQLLKEASETCLITSWAESIGISAPIQTTESYIKKWEENHQIIDRTKWLNQVQLEEETYIFVLTNRFFYHWVIKKGCNFFGFDLWSLDHDLIKELQVTGQIANFVKQIESSKL